MSDETTTVRRSVDGPIGRIELARPDKLNALDRATLEGLTAAAEWFNAQPGVKVVVVGAEGPSFSAGFDLGDPSWRELGPPEHSGITGRAMAVPAADLRLVALHGQPEDHPSLPVWPEGRYLKLAVLM